jgi:hypothetical protein
MKYYHIVLEPISNKFGSYVMMSTIQNVRDEHRKHIYKIAEKLPQYFEANECNHNLMRVIRKCQIITMISNTL